MGRFDWKEETRVVPNENDDGHTACIDCLYSAIDQENPHNRSRIHIFIGEGYGVNGVKAVLHYLVKAPDFELAKRGNDFYIEHDKLTGESFKIIENNSPCCYWEFCSNESRLRPNDEHEIGKAVDELKHLAGKGFDDRIQYEAKRHREYVEKARNEKECLEGYAGNMDEDGRFFWSKRSFPTNVFGWANTYWMVTDKAFPANMSTIVVCIKERSGEATIWGSFYISVPQKFRESLVHLVQDKYAGLECEEPVLYLSNIDGCFGKIDLHKHYAGSVLKLKNPTQKDIDDGLLTAKKFVETNFDDKVNIIRDECIKIMEYNEAMAHYMETGEENYHE